MTQPEDPTPERCPWPIGTDFATGEPEMVDLNDGLSQEEWESIFKQATMARQSSTPILANENLRIIPNLNEQPTLCLYQIGVEKFRAYSNKPASPTCPTCGQPHP